MVWRSPALSTASFAVGAQMPFEQLMFCVVPNEITTAACAAPAKTATASAVENAEPRKVKLKRLDAGCIAFPQNQFGDKSTPETQSLSRLSQSKRCAAAQNGVGFGRVAALIVVQHQPRKQSERRT